MSLDVGSAERLMSTGQRVAVRDGAGGAVSWLQGDNLGSASMTTDANGAKTSEYRYTPYGGVRVAWGSLPTNRKFTGYAREDAIGGIDFAQARFYDSVIGRFLSADTIYDGGLADPQGLNRYSYVKGHVMNATDPTGHQGSCVLTGSCPSPFYGGREGAELVGFLIGMGVGYATGKAIAAADQSLSTPLNVAPAASNNTAGTIPNVQQPLVLADPNSTVTGAGGIETYPNGSEAGSLQLTTPLENSSTVQAMGPLLSQDIYHRRPIDPSEIELVESSGELWGQEPRNFLSGGKPAVKAYIGPLPPNAKGYEFTTSVKPDRWGHPREAFWTGPRPGVRVEDGWAKIECTVVRKKC